MILENTKEEENAIKSLERAFKKCSDLKIKFSVMDNTLHYANPRLYKECEKVEDSVSGGKYPTVAYAQDTKLGECPYVKTHKSMESCGGW
jgi:predicted glycosyl hydrolase (DUF1957 family)